MVFLQLNLVLAIIISLPAIFSYQAKRPTNSLYWMIVTLLVSNIYLSFEIEDNHLVISSHVISNSITVLSIIISASILWLCIYRTTNEPTRKIFSSMVIYEIFLVVLGSCYFIVMNVVPTLLTSQIEISALTLGIMVLILGFALVITENNLFKTGVGLLAIQNGAHIVINSLGLVAPGISVILNGLQIFIAIIFVSVISEQYKATGSVLVRDYATLRH
jgi:hypothetical protein